MQTPQKIAIVGSGLVGSLLAIYLRKAGHTVHIYDRSPDIRQIEFSGRSINLAMSNRGWKALDGVGVGDAVRQIAIPMDKRAIHLVDKLNFQAYGQEGEAIYSISRGLLNRKMIDLAEAAGAEFFFEQKIWDVTLADATLHIGESERGAWEEKKYDMVFGADGAFSRIRHRMQRQSMFDYSQEFLKIGYKELNIPANPDGTHKLDPNSFHIWPRGEYMLIALPNLDGSFTCTLFMPFEGDNSLAELKDINLVKAFFAKNFPDSIEVIPMLAEDFFKNPTSTLVTMKCFPWAYEDKIALIGDACHAIVPFYGQGMNAGFEDCTVMNRLMHKHNHDWDAIFAEYSTERKPDGDALQDLSVDNYYVMRDYVADPAFILRKKIEAKFSELHPDRWLPLYSQVTFSNIRYSDAYRQGNIQSEIMDEIMALPNIEEEWDSKIVMDILLEKSADFKF